MFAQRSRIRPARALPIGCIAAAALILACDAAGAQILVRVGKAQINQFGFVPADVGVDTGLFKKQGLDVRISAFAGDAKLMQVLAAGGVDSALGGSPALAAIAVSPAAADAGYDDTMPVMSTDGRFDPKALNVLATSFVEMHMLPAKPQMSMLVSDAFLPR